MSTWHHLQAMSVRHTTEAFVMLCIVGGWFVGWIYYGFRRF